MSPGIQWMHDDQTWLENLRSSGEEREKAIGQLRELLLRGLSQSLNNRYGKPFSAEDVVQDALLKILASLDQFEGRSRFTTWAMTIATRIGISSLRRKYHADASLDSFSADNGYRMEVASKDDRSDSMAYEKEELLSKLQELIDERLTEKQRMVMRTFLAGFSTDGISQNTGMKRNAVYKLLHDARLKLKAGFEEAGISADDVLSTLA